MVRTTLCSEADRTGSPLRSRIRRQARYPSPRRVLPRRFLNIVIIGYTDFIACKATVPFSPPPPGGKRMLLSAVQPGLLGSLSGNQAAAPRSHWAAR